jgi:cation transport regulator ChaB
MPYIKNADLPKAVRDALPENVQTIYRNAHNGAGKQYGYANEIRLSKLAWSAVKREYKQDKDKKWVAREAKAEVPKAGKREYTIDEWVPIARKGQKIGLNGVFYTVGQDAIDSTKDTWIGANALINHNNIWEKHELVDEKVEGEFVYAKLDQDIINELNSSETNGISIEAILTDIDTGGVVHEMIGTGYSLLYGGHKPACTFEMGCASISSSTSKEFEYDIIQINNMGSRVKIRTASIYTDRAKMSTDEIKAYLAREVGHNGEGTFYVYKHDESLRIGDVIDADKKVVHTVVIAVSEKANNIPTNKANGGLVTAEKQGYVESQKGGGHKDMADKVDKVVYTVEQLNERVAGALADQKEADDNALKVAVAEGVETQKTEDKEVIDGLTKEKEASDAIIKAQADAALKERRATFMQRYGAEEGSEVLKQWDAAKTLEDSQILTNQLEFPTQQVAGASSGSAVGSSDNNIQDRMAKLGIPGIEFTEGK